MKRTAFIISLACILAGCSSGVEVNPEVSGTFVSACAADAPQSTDGTRAYLSESEYRFYWAADDAISVVTGSENKKFTLTEGANTANAGFYCPGDVASGRHYAVYPYDKANSIVGSDLKINYPAVLSYDAAHHSAGSNTMVAVNPSALDFQFSNACSIIRLALTGTDKLRSIEITSIDGKPLCGDAIVSFNEAGDPEITMTDGDPKVKVDFGSEGFQLTDAVQYIYVSLPPARLSKGVKVLFVSDDYTTVNKSVSSATLPRSLMLEMVPLALSSDGFVDLSVKCSDEQGLDISQTANCYIVREAGKHKFPAMMQGNSLESIGTPTKAVVMWETFNTELQPAKGALVRTNLEYKDGYVRFIVPTPYRNGNALVAVTDDAGTILWSWHLWFTADAFSTASINGYEMLDRNLGALSAKPEDGVATFGLLYQWGRKDPFIGSAKADAAVPVAVAGTAIKTVSSSATVATVEYAIAHPTEYINSSGSEWLTVSDDALWDVDKTKYDPCPPGYCLPGKDWTSGMTSSWTTGPANGRLYKAKGAWFPAAGKYSYTSSGASLDQTLKQVGTQGRVWSATPVEGGTTAYGFGFEASSYSSASSYNRNCAYSVRCVKE